MTMVAALTGKTYVISPRIDTLAAFWAHRFALSERVVHVCNFAVSAPFVG